MERSLQTMKVRLEVQRETLRIAQLRRAACERECAGILTEINETKRQIYAMERADNGN